MKACRALLALSLFGLLALAGCESSPSTAPASAGAAMMPAGPAQQKIATGQALFTARCVGCHTLPKIADHSAEQWPGIVAQMAKRSGLKPDESQSVIDYLLAARRQAGG